MKRVLVGLCLVGLLAENVFALSQISSVGFRNISTANNPAMTCSVLSGELVRGGINPSAANSTLVAITKTGFGTYTVQSTDTQLYIRCFPTSTGIEAPVGVETPYMVKMFFNGSETFYYPMSSITLTVK